MAAAEDQSVAGISIVGDAGVGKTRLAAELVSMLTARDRPVAWVAATGSARVIPFGALASVVKVPSGDADQPQPLVQMLGELRDQGTDAGPLVLAVDDAHHLDDHSASLIHLAVSERAVVLVLTARSGEELPGALMQLWKDGLIDRIEVGPLGRRATGDLAEAVLEGSVESMTLSDLWRRSAGNPLFLRELILGGVEAGTLVQQDGTWRSSGTPVPSARLAELVRERLGRLNRPEQRVVEALAVGDLVDMRMIEHLAMAGVMESLEERRIASVEQTGNRSYARLAHPIYTEVVLAAMPRSRVRRIMGELADALAATGARRAEDTLRLAVWLLDSRGKADGRLLLEAAADALASFDGELAERFARAALNERQGVRALLLLGRALSAQQQVEAANDALERAAVEASLDGEVAPVALARAELLYFRAGRVADATQVLVDALEVVEESDWRDELEGLLVLFRAGAGQLRPVAEAGRRMAARPDARPRAVVHTLLYSTIANVMLGRFADAEQQIDVGLRLAPAVRSELPMGAEMLAINRVVASAYAGDLERALALGADGLRAALDSGASEVMAMWSMNLGECQLLAGRVEEALGSMLSALAVAREADPFGVRGIDASVASIAADWLGRHELARSLRREVIEHDLAIDVRSRIWLDRATVWGLVPDSGPKEAADRAVEAGRRAVADTHLMWAAWLFHDSVRLGDPAVAAPRLAKLADQTGGSMVPAMALHASALAEGDPVKLERAASAFERIGAILFAAEAAAHAQQSYLQRGRQRMARIAGARASLLAARCPGTRTPALVHAAPAVLTPRELDVVTLAAEGV
ncbi:MAG TPA: AAA family ATPase, partial [Egibacteraceae bacterium]|nr:AAA family ATPase [Egibacteraceae bacterium]